MVTLGFRAIAEPPPAQKGVDPNESVGILFALQGGGTYADILQELSDGTLRAGLHVINFDSEGSESFVNIPEPATIALLGAGLSLLALLRRRKSP